MSSRLLKFLLLFNAILFAQQDPVLSIDVKRVVLHATVREGKARFVGDLKKENFTVLEDKVPQELLSFSREDVPVAIGLLIDNSASMMNKRAEVLAAAKEFIRASKPTDELFIIHFNENLTYGLPSDTPFTGDQKKLELALDTMHLDGKTALYDAIHEGLKHLETSKLSKKALMVISDGGDNMSKTKDKDVIREADLSGALFYGIAIYDEMDGDANPAVIRRLAASTGGESFFPKDVKEVRSLCAIIARDLKNQYMLSYSPKDRPNADNYRRLEVKIKDPQHRKLIVRTRTGYFAEELGMKAVPKK